MANKNDARVILDAEFVEMAKDLLHDVIDDLGEAGKSGYQDLTEEDCELYGAIVDICGLIINPNINKMEKVN